MSDVVEISVALLRRYAEFTKKLTPEQLNGIVSGELKFALEGGKKQAVMSVDAGAIETQLSRLDSREEAAAYIDSLRLTVPKLKAVARDLAVSLAGASVKEQIRDRIVEHTVGFRLNSRAIREGDWN